MSTVVPGASEFRQRQALLFDRMEDLSLTSYELRAGWHRFGDLVRPKDRHKYPKADAVSLPVTEEYYSLEGIDPRPAAEDLFYTYVRMGEEWFIAEDTDLDDLTMYSSRHLWDLGPVDVLTASDFVLFSHPCATGGLCGDSGLLADARSAMGRVTKYWNDVPERVAILVPSDQEVVERMIQATFELDNFVAFAYSSEDLSEGLDYTGNRIILNPPAFGGRSTDSSRTILAHELLHIVTRDASGPFIPVFVEEGFAEYVGYDANRSSLSFLSGEIAAGNFDRQIPEDFEFLIGSGTEIFRSYQESESAVFFFIERWGLDRFKRFYRRLGRIEIAPGTVRYWLDKTLRRTIGMDLDGFEKAWADSIASS
ncbi:MAG TPA: hypothetical protein VNP73_01795 [Actinomycetota bacterium]|nr:hypothetical protein [Actinomycetota bacterium]